MSFFIRIRSLLSNLFRKDHVEQELDAEVRSYLDELMDEKIAAGLDPDEASRAARIEMGGLEQVKEQVRDVRAGFFLEQMAQDLRHGLRMLRKNLGFTAVAVLTLALGIGANSVIFGLVNAVLIRPLPYADANRLVSVYSSSLKREAAARRAISPLNYDQLKEQKGLFNQLTANRGSGVILTGGDEPEELVGTFASANLFATLGVRAALGRTFTADEERSSDERVVVISHALWQRRFHRDPNIIDQVLTIDGSSYTVIGVMPPEFRFPVDRTSELWVPTTFQGTGRNINVVGRLRDGISISQAQRELDVVAERLEQENPSLNAGQRLRLIGLLEDVVGKVQPALLVLLGAVGFVLLIACVNVANLLLARANLRKKEMALRAALGAGRFRLIRQLLTESLVLAVLGGGLGLCLAYISLDLLIAISPVDIPRAESIRIDSSVLGFTMLVSLLTGFVFGLAPAVQSSGVDLNTALKDRPSRLMWGARRHRARDLLVVCEVALSFILLIGAGLMLHSFWRLTHVDSGLKLSRVLTADAALPSSKYGNARQQAAFYKQVLDQVRMLPEVESASAASTIPLCGAGIGDSFKIEGATPSPGDEPLTAGVVYVAENYFATMGIPIKGGRDFDYGDSAAAAPVVIINQTMARRFWPDQDPLGKRLTVAKGKPREIVGVAGDVRHFGLDREPRAEMYLPYQQAPYLYLSLVMRTAKDPMSVAGAVKAQVQAVDPDQPVSNFKTMDQYLSDSVAYPRFQSYLLSIFAALAGVLAAVGLYGVIAYTVTQRTHEIGIRMALGAQPRDVLRQVIGQGMILTLLGVGIGTAAAYGLARLMANLLFGVGATDPVVFGLVALLLIAVALPACYLPGRRATKIDPMLALRCE